MSGFVIGLALLAAMLHATWNAFLRTGTDRLWTVTVMSFSSTIIAAPAAFFFPLPTHAAWLFIVLSAILQVGYSFFLVAAYRLGELGQVYPVVRGSVPLLVTFGGLCFAHQTLTFTQSAGVLLVAFGIMSLSLGKGRAPTKSIFYAVATGAVIASYATVDAIGVRRAENSTSYIIWVLILYGALLPAAYLAHRRSLTIDFKSGDTRKAFVGGVVALIGYGLVTAAFALGPAGPITAIRETSVVFAAIIGRLFLQEKLTTRRVAACIVVVAGAVCIG